MYEYISGFFHFEGHAKVRGKLYDLGEYPAGVPSTEDCFVVGELYKIRNEHEFSWAIGQLDDYEGMTTEEGETALYRRELAEAQIHDQTVPAWVYWYNGDVTGRPIIASGDMLEYLNQKK